MAGETKKYILLVETDQGALLLNPHFNNHPIVEQALRKAGLSPEIAKTRVMFSIDDLRDVVHFVRTRLQGKLYINGIFPLYFITAIANPLLSLAIYDPKIGGYVDERLFTEQGPMEILSIIKIFEL